MAVVAAAYAYEAAAKSAHAAERANELMSEANLRMLEANALVREQIERAPRTRSGPENRTASERGSGTTQIGDSGLRSFGLHESIVSPHDPEHLLEQDIHSLLHAIHRVSSRHHPI